MWVISLRSKGRPGEAGLGLEPGWEPGWVARAMRGLTRACSGSVWSSYRKSCVDMVMKWLVPESSGRYVNRMTNEALHKGVSRDPMTVGQKS